MKVLVAGGAGFIGTNLTKVLLDRNYEVYCLDNFQTSTRENIERFENLPNYHLIEGDVTETINCKVNWIFNLASPASPVHYQASPIETFMTNVLGTNKLLELAEKNGSRMLQASTSEVYGDPLEHPQNETYWGHVNPIGIRACYDEGKRGAETICFDFFRAKEIDIRVARIFNTYGPQMHPQDGRVVSNFIVQALNGRSLTLYGDGMQTRSFCFVDDLVKGLMAYMDFPNLLPGPINLGNPKEFTVRELAELVIQLTESESKIEYQPLPEDDPRKRKPDISLAKNKLSWEPKIDLIEGVQRTIEYFRNRPSQSISGKTVK